MRVNVYAEELPEEGSVEIISKEIEGRMFTGLRIPLYLPVTLPNGDQVRGKFMHHADDDDSSAITIWGKRDLRVLLREALDRLDAHYSEAGGSCQVEPICEVVPTHRCKECGAYWNLWPAFETGFPSDTWSLASKECGDCCDNVEMGPQIERVTFEHLSLDPSLVR